MIGNCLLRAIFEKIKKPIRVKICLLLRKDRKFPHFVWLLDGIILYHFTDNKEKVKPKWFVYILYNGHVEEVPKTFMKKIKVLKVII